MLVDAKSQALFAARAKIIKAMAHPTRLFVVTELSQCDEKCVCDLTEMIGADMSTVSRHLAVLKNAGLVVDDKRGQQVYYRLRVKCIVNFLKCVQTVLENNAQAQQELLA